MPNFIHGNARDHRRKQITSAMGRCAATAWISPQRIWIDSISLSSYLARSKIYEVALFITEMKIGSYNKCKTTSASKHQLISVVLSFVNSLTKVITVFAFFNTQLYFLLFEKWHCQIDTFCLHSHMMTRQKPLTIFSLWKINHCWFIPNCSREIMRLLVDDMHANIFSSKSFLCCVMAHWFTCLCLVPEVVALSFKNLPPAVKLCHK